jgi:hypothetical protein
MGSGLSGSGGTGVWVGSGVSVLRGTTGGGIGVGVGDAV